MKDLSFDSMADYVLDRYGKGEEAVRACQDIQRNLGWDANKLIDAVRNRKPVGAGK